MKIYKFTGVVVRLAEQKTAIIKVASAGEGPLRLVRIITLDICFGHSNLSGRVRESNIIWITYIFLISQAQVSLGLYGSSLAT